MVGFYFIVFAEGKGSTGIHWTPDLEIAVGYHFDYDIRFRYHILGQT
jgi:hypothetical protein